MDKRKVYLAYGSNLNVEQMMRRCPDAEPLGTAWLDGYELEFRGSYSGAYLSVRQSYGKRTPLGAWLVSDEDEKALDHYEGFPRFYYKRDIAIPVKYLSNGHTYKRQAFIYIMNANSPAGVPSDAYVRICEMGYNDFGFDKRILYAAVRESRDKEDELSPWHYKNVFKDRMQGKVR